MTPRISKTALFVSLLAIGMAKGQQEKTSDALAEPSTPEAIKQFNDDKVAELSEQIAGKGGAAPVGKEAEVANANEALGEQMQQEAAQELIER